MSDLGSPPRRPTARLWTAFKTDTGGTGLTMAAALSSALMFRPVCVNYSWRHKENGEGENSDASLSLPPFVSQHSYLYRPEVWKPELAKNACTSISYSRRAQDYVFGSTHFIPFSQVQALSAEGISRQGN